MSKKQKQSESNLPHLMEIVKQGFESITGQLGDICVSLLELVEKLSEQTEMYRQTFGDSQSALGDILGGFGLPKEIPKKEET